MTCMIHTKNIYFTVKKMSRNEEIAYIFIGNINSTIKIKLDNLNNDKSIFIPAHFRLLFEDM